MTATMNTAHRQDKTRQDKNRDTDIVPDMMIDDEKDYSCCLINS